MPTGGVLVGRWGKLPYLRPTCRRARHPPPRGASLPGGFEGVEIIAQADLNPDDEEYKLFVAVMEQYGDGLEISGTSASAYQAMLAFIRAANAGGSTDMSPAGVRSAIESMPAAPLPLGGGATFQYDGSAIPAISKNVCFGDGFIADAAADGSLSGFRTLDAAGIYEQSGS